MNEKYRIPAYSSIEDLDKIVKQHNYENVERHTLTATNREMLDFLQEEIDRIKALTQERDNTLKKQLRLAVDVGAISKQEAIKYWNMHQESNAKMFKE